MELTTGKDGSYELDRNREGGSVKYKEVHLHAERVCGSCGTGPLLPVLQMPNAAIRALGARLRRGIC